MNQGGVNLESICVLRSPTLPLSLGERCPTFYPESLGAFCLVKRGETNQEEICGP